MDYTIREMPMGVKPRERLISLGANALSDYELLAIVLRSGSKKEDVLNLARRLIVKFGGLYELLDADVNQLCVLGGIGIVKAVTLKAVLEISLRIKLKKNLSVIKGPRDAFLATRKDFFGKKQEILCVLCLDSRNNLISKDIISTGTINQAIVSPREIYKHALLKGAVSIILVHNHPSRDVSPSADDVMVTQQVYRVGKEIGVTLIDHIVIGGDSFRSLKAHNLLIGEEVEK